MEQEKKCNCTSECECGCQEEKECTCNDDCCCSIEECDCQKEEKKQKKKSSKKDDIVKKLEDKIKELEEKALREKADSINFRKRKEEETSRMLKYKDEELIMELLPIIDNFENAIKMDDNNLDDEVSKFLSGFKMIYGNLISILENIGVKVIDGKNKPFDPTYHQAVLTEKVDGVEKDIVLDVLRKGYLLKDKVLRPAMVKVSE